MSNDDYDDELYGTAKEKRAKISPDPLEKKRFFLNQAGKFFEEAAKEMAKADKELLRCLTKEGHIMPAGDYPPFVARNEYQGEWKLEHMGRPVSSLPIEGSGESYIEKVAMELYKANQKLLYQNTKLQREMEETRRAPPAPALPPYVSPPPLALQEDVVALVKGYKALAKSADEACRFFCGMNLRDHPLSDQREAVRVLQQLRRDLGKSI